MAIPVTSPFSESERLSPSMDEMRRGEADDSAVNISMAKASLIFDHVSPHLLSITMWQWSGIR